MCSSAVSSRPVLKEKNNISQGLKTRTETDENLKMNTSTFYWYLLIKQSQASQDFHPQLIVISSTQWSIQYFFFQ